MRRSSCWLCLSFGLSSMLLAPVAAHTLLLSKEDGRVVPALRSLAAEYATHMQQTRGAPFHPSNPLVMVSQGLVTIDAAAGRCDRRICRQTFRGDVDDPPTRVLAGSTRNNRGNDAVEAMSFNNPVGSGNRPRGAIRCRPEVPAGALRARHVRRRLARPAVS